MQQGVGCRRGVEVAPAISGDHPVCNQKHGADAALGDGLLVSEGR